jgi:hypothetical protein
MKRARMVERREDGCQCRTSGRGVARLASVTRNATSGWSDAGSTGLPCQGVGGQSQQTLDVSEAPSADVVIRDAERLGQFLGSADARAAKFLDLGGTDTFAKTNIHGAFPFWSIMITIVNIDVYAIFQR